MAIKGIDVSQWQGTIDWKKVAGDGIKFVIIRAGFGNSIAQKDPTLDYNLKNAKTAGLKIGVYWFSYAKSVADAKKEADVCVKALNGTKLDYPVFFDWEDDSLRYCKQNGVYPNKAMVTEFALAFMQRIEELGYKAGLYSNPNYLNLYFDRNSLKKYPLWIAAWGSTKPTAYGDVDFWQYSESGRVNGIVGNVDMNWSYTDFAGNKTTTNTTTTTAKPSAPTVTYRVMTKNGWLPAVTNLSDYAGDGTPILNLAMKVSSGSVKYRVHIKGGSWLPYVTGYSTTDHNNGYAGAGKAIDAVQVVYTAPSGKSYRIKYRVAPVGGGYYDYQYGIEKTGGQDGYAGYYGQAIGKFQATIV